MSRHQRTLGAYRLAVRLYPKRFREEYGPDLVGLVTDQLREEPTWRVLGRTTVDLALTVPTRHLEAHMSRSATTLVPLMLVSAHRARPLTEPRPTSGNWWKLLGGGSLVLAVLIATTTATGELPEGAWFLAMVTLFTALVLIGAGIVLGIAHLASRANRSTAA
jgi:hypothetical protein